MERRREWLGQGGISVNFQDVSRFPNTGEDLGADT